jgi:hypothetical protein
MADFKAYKEVSVLPSTLVPSAIYLVRTGAGFDLYASDSTGAIAHSLNLPSGGAGTRTVKTLASAFVSTVVARANVTGLSFAVTAGKKYDIKLIGSYQTAVLTTGGSIGFVLSSGTGTIVGFATMAVSQATGAGDLTTTIRAINATNTTAGSFATSTGVSVINSPHYFNAELILNCLTTGVFQVQFASEIAATSAQMNADAVMIVEVLN